MGIQLGLCNTWLLLLLYHVTTWAAYVLAGKKRHMPIETPNPPLPLRKAGSVVMMLTFLLLIVSIVIPMNRGLQMAAGLFLYCIGLAISLSAILSFLRPTDELNTAGIYRFSRNPMYTGSFFALTGAAVCAFRPGIPSLVFIVLIIAWALAVHSTVKQEEAMLSSLHGDAFRRYRARVPRYLVF